MFKENMARLLKDAYIAKLSGIVEYKNDKEMWWESFIGTMFTIEFIENSIDNAIIRSYHANDQVYQIMPLKNGVAHGKFIVFFGDGSVHWEDDYENGVLHGKQIDYYCCCGGYSQKATEHSWKNGVEHGHIAHWDSNGHLEWECWAEDGVHGTKSFY